MIHSSETISITSTSFARLDDFLEISGQRPKVTIDSVLNGCHEYLSQQDNGAEHSNTTRIKKSSGMSRLLQYFKPEPKATETQMREFFHALLDKAFRLEINGKSVDILNFVYSPQEDSLSIETQYGVNTGVFSKDVTRVLRNDIPVEICKDDNFHDALKLIRNALHKGLTAWIPEADLYLEKMDKSNEKYQELKMQSLHQMFTSSPESEVEKMLVGIFEKSEEERLQLYSKMKKHVTPQDRLALRATWRVETSEAGTDSILQLISSLDAPKLNISSR